MAGTVPALPGMRLSRRRVLTAAAAAVAGALGPQPLAATPGPAGRALWIWGTPAAQWPRVAAIMGGAGFDTAFLSIPPADRIRLAMAPDALTAALAPFADHGVRVLLAGGDPRWADGRPMAPAFADLLDLATRSPHIAGVELDIEPYTLPLWRSGPQGRERIATALMDRLDQARRRLAGSGRRLETILHPAFANAPLPPGHGGGTMADGAIARADGVVVMAYRNTPDAVARFAGRLLDSLDRHPRPWRFGITVQGGQEHPFVSYADSPYATIAADMAALDALAATRASADHYRGVAVHAYASLAPKLAP